MAIDQHNIDKIVPIPLYYQLKQIILNEIDEGVYLPGDMIPTEKELSGIFDISRTTVRQAVTELVQEGKLYRIKSKGTFVSKPKIKQDFIKKIETFNEQIKRLGMIPTTKVLEIRVIDAPDHVRKMLNLGDKSECILIMRKRFADAEPNVVVRTYLSYDLCRFILDHDLENESLYEILAKEDQTRIFRINRVVEAVLADEKDAKMLDIRSGMPIHYFISTGYNRYNQPIEYSFARYRGDRNKFDVDVYYTKPD